MARSISPTRKGCPDKTENLYVDQIGSLKAESRVCWVKGVELDVVFAVGDLFYESLVTVEDDGYAAAIDAGLFVDLNYVAVLDLGGHTVARDLDTDGFISFAVGTLPCASTMSPVKKLMFNAAKVLPREDAKISSRKIQGIWMPFNAQK